MADQDFTFTQQIHCVEREITMRESVYSRLVERKKLKQERAVYELACMRAVWQTLIRLNKQFEETRK